jgi:peptidoglycan/LPS O-acetylase OafA/YrhL
MSGIENKAIQSESKLVNKEPAKALHLKGLNGIRAIAASSVVISHVILSLNRFGLTKINDGWDFAGYGVTMFFTLSGFLITYLLMLEKEKTHTVSIKDFYIRRILRIWPLYYLVIVISYLLMYFYFKDEFTTGNLTFYIFLSANIATVVNAAVPLIGHYWSLGVEEQFYLIWPWLFKKVPPLKAVTIFLFCFLTLKIIFRVVMPQSVIYQFINLTKFDCMAIGALFAILYTTNSSLLPKKYFFSNITQVICWIVFLLAAFGKLFLPDFINHDVFSIATGVIIINIAFNPNVLVSLENKLFDFIGRISYGIYVYHVMVIILLGKLLTNRIPVFNAVLQTVMLVVIVFFITILISYISYNFFEKKFLLLKAKFTKILSKS